MIDMPSKMIVYRFIFLLCCSFWSAAFGNQNVTDAIVEADLAKVIELVKGGVSANQENDGWPLLVLAASHGEIEIVEFLIKKGARINIRNGNGDTPLVLAAYQGHVDVVESLLKNGADPNMAGYDGGTALIWAVNKRHKKVVSRLLSHKADPNIGIRPHWFSSLDQERGGGNGATALMFAAQIGNSDLITRLLDAGADVNQTDNYCHSVLDYATHERGAALADLLRQRGAKDSPVCLSYYMKRLLVGGAFIAILIAVGRRLIAENLSRRDVIIRVLGLLANFLWAGGILALLFEDLFYPTKDMLVFYMLIIVPFLSITAIALSSKVVFLKVVLGVNIVVLLLLFLRSAQLSSGGYHPVAFAIMESILFFAMLLFPLVNVVMLAARIRGLRQKEYSDEG